MNVNRVEDFAARLRLRIKRDECGEPIIPGKRGHIFDRGDGSRFGVLLMLLTKARWTYAKKKLRAAGFLICQDGDTEGSALFDADNPGQARVALKIARVKRRRIASPAQLSAARKGLEAALFRRNPLAGASFGARNDDPGRSSMGGQRMETSAKNVPGHSDRGVLILE